MVTLTCRACSMYYIKKIKLLRSSGVDNAFDKILIPTLAHDFSSNPYKNLNAICMHEIIICM